jgi:hypothetical protein
MFRPLFLAIIRQFCTVTPNCFCTQYDAKIQYYFLFLVHMLMDFRTLKITVFWNAMPCSLVEGYHRFRGTTASVIGRWKQQVLPNLRYLSTRLHSFTSQMTVIFIVTVVRTSNLKCTQVVTRRERESGRAVVFLRI